METERIDKPLIRIAIDGPAGAGKSSIAKLLAIRLGIDYIDTGAMYRAFALKLLESGVDYRDEAALNSLLDSTDIDFSGGHTLLDGRVVDGDIRTPAVTDMASESSAMLAVREKLAAMQTTMGHRKSVVMDGRDIGTVVLTYAEFKFYLTAPVQIRAKRRALEMEQRGETVDLPALIEDIAARDYRDSHRENSPLRRADDAIEIDTGSLTMQQVLDEMMSYIDAR